MSRLNGVMSERIAGANFSADSLLNGSERDPRRGTIAHVPLSIAIRAPFRFDRDKSAAYI